MAKRHLQALKNDAVSPELPKLRGNGKVCAEHYNECATFIFHDAVVGFVDRSLSSARNLAAPNSTSRCVLLAECWPNISPGNKILGQIRKFRKQIPGRLSVRIAMKDSINSRANIFVTQEICIQRNITADIFVT